ncbi:MAG: DOMON-like domain-containing protein [Sphingomonadaceae bacterium]|nr:DOMON-like domain-containing protein [Sphingomonadaceae bacterium]
MHSLTLHPDCTPGPVRSVQANIEPSQGGCTVRFILRGDITRLKIPGFMPPGRADELWQTTCCEMFWQHEGASAYREFNLSPSSQWACYDFTGRREGRSGGEVSAIAIAHAHNGEELTLHASIGAELLLPARVALTAVIELKDGMKQYWSLAFGDGEPDFHDPACRSLKLAGAL